MPTPVRIEARRALRKAHGFNALYTALLLLSLHWAVVLYVNSSYLEQFVGANIIGMLYVISAVFTIFAFLYATPVLRRFGNVKLIVFLTIIEFFTLLGMGFLPSAMGIIFFFILHQAIVPVILFGLDILMEELIGTQEGSTGGKRGILLTIMSLTTALAALAMGSLLGAEIPNFAAAYLVSALILFPFLYIVLKYFKKFKDPVYPNFQMLSGIQSFWRKKDIRNVFFAHFLLQLFFTWMVIYTPVYLASVIGFNWEQIGIILFIGLLAYVFLEYLIGYAADNVLGEKEMMALGFAITALATSWFIFLDNSSIIVWMIAMFMTRVGASFIEVTTESYFFKHIGSKDTNLIGVFRITRPLSYLIGAVLGSLTLYLFDFNFMFVILGLLMIPGLFFAMALKDTK